MPIRDYYQVLASDLDFNGAQDQVTEHTVDWDETPAIKGGHPRPLWFEIVVKETFVGGGASAVLLQPVVQNADGAAGTFKDILTGPEILLADLAKGATFYIPYPMMGLDDDDKPIFGGPNQVLRLNISHSATSPANFTAGKLDVVLSGG